MQQIPACAAVRALALETPQIAAGNSQIAINDSETQIAIPTKLGEAIQVVYTFEKGLRRGTTDAIMQRTGAFLRIIPPGDNITPPTQITP